MNKKWFGYFVGIPLVVLVLATLLFRLTALDCDITGHFYNEEGGFYLKAKQPWLFLYDHGNVPGLAIGFFGLFLLIAGLFWKKLGSHRRVGIFLVLLLIIGPGIVVNSVFKGHWGRPRPQEIMTFGGEQAFLPVWQKGIAGNGKSFPSGHASIGYYLMAPFFFLYPLGRRRWGLLFLFSGLAYGTAMGLGRIVQGAHFTSDVLWSAGFVYFIGLLLSLFFRFDRRDRAPGGMVQTHGNRNE
jgi:membrane-associated PAP2 superfamily phosphatase